MDKHFFYALLNKYLDGTATAEERKLLESYHDILADKDIPGLSQADRNRIIAQIESAVMGRIRTPAPVIPLRRRWARIAVAASLFLGISTASYFLFSGHKQQSETKLATTRFKNDIEPGHSGAVLTLGNGAQVKLDSLANGIIPTEEKTRVEKFNGTLAYESVPADKQQQIIYNTVSTPKGRDYELKLADGTRVWLDAMSSIRFPTSFPGKERMVEITGQAYFEVAHNARQPFRVKAANQTIEVLGTHFNVNAYTPEIKTTLLEGAVKLTVTNMSEKYSLKPGEQALLNGDNIHISTDADTTEVVAWKNNRFRFSGATIQDILTQVSRWYDMDIVYKSTVHDVFVANISRDVALSRLLNLLEMTKEVQFTIDGKTVTVEDSKEKQQ